MADALLELRSQHARLAEVLARGEWARLGEVDASIRALLERLAAGPALDAAGQLAKRRLGELHGEARNACAREVERLRVLLASHLDYAEGRTAYMQIDRLLAAR
ncbi:hypothetical protein [Pseudomonas citronellolis]|uniref:hypothetical protein n=1 Tax=Pseudomonas citronellolis TaxID=53408 RepID=UPI0023E3C43A|nr:hypothetical protein [Pseudomonas citronellolis]MDF3933846.1 hypothetical protein [Pseudomonas citronellolis]